MTHIKSLIEDSKLFNSGIETDQNIEKNEPKLTKRFKKAKQKRRHKYMIFFLDF